jgi:hypothetical protein
MSTRVFRGAPRTIALTLAFLAGAAFFSGAATLAKDRAVLAIGLYVLAGLCLLVALRLPFTRAVASSDGLTLHTAVGNTNVPWATIASVSSGTTEHDGLLTVRTPILNLTTGKKVAVSSAAFYSSAKAARVAAELESLRQAYTSDRA